MTAILRPIGSFFRSSLGMRMVSDSPGVHREKVKCVGPEISLGRFELLLSHEADPPVISCLV